jgi:hypothetical protein
VRKRVYRRCNKKKKRWKTKSNQWDKVQSRKLVAKGKKGGPQPVEYVRVV